MATTRGERAFLVCLGAALAPFLALPMEWAFALHQLFRRDGDADDRRWGRRLLGLALVDVAVAAALAAYAWGGLQPKPLPQVPVIGVELDGARIKRVVPGLPAERAGVVAGDQLAALDGQPIADRASLRARLAEAPPDRPRTLRVRRDGNTRDFVVTPLGPRAPSLFEPSEAGRSF